MRTEITMAALALSTLSACGGAGGVASTPAPGSGPSPAPAPTPANSFISDLVASQTFTGTATKTNMTVRTVDGIVQNSSGARGTITVRYDGASRSYSVETTGMSQTFSATDVQSPRAEGETQFRKSAAGVSDTLTLVTTPYYGGTKANQYVGLGYWQRNSQSSGIQSTDFNTFTYGFDTGSSAMPRSGKVQWDTDIFGLLTTSGQEIRTIQGRGTFDVDFGSGHFSTFANVDEFDFISGGGRVGSLRFQAAGQLSNAPGFGGNLSYTSGTQSVAGTIAGKFYGPGAEEIGATFDAQGSGTILTGALTGQRATAPSVTDFTLLDISREQSVPAFGATLTTQARDGTPGLADVKSLTTNAVAIALPAGQARISVGSDSYTPVASELVPGARVNFSTYQSQASGEPLSVEYYKPGNANTELALTYTSFATWSSKARDLASADIGIENRTIHHILYGFETPRDLLSARTGSANYKGVVYGHGASMSGLRYDVGGTSRFTVDFSASRYSGALDLVGKVSDGTSVAFGSFGFESTLSSGAFAQASFDNGANADPFQFIQPHFFGPDGQEIGATFKLGTGPQSDIHTVLISGVAVAKRQ